MKDQFYHYIQSLQDAITSAVEELDGTAIFEQDVWHRKEGGGGQTRVISDGTIFEKGGVNISAVHGELPKALQKQFAVNQSDFYACGLSLVLHPQNPFVPAVHANWRYFEIYDTKRKIVSQWFGGGQDLPPFYFFEEDAGYFSFSCNEMSESEIMKQIKDFYR